MSPVHTPRKQPMWYFPLNIQMNAHIRYMCDHVPAFHSFLKRARMASGLFTAFLSRWLLSRVPFKNRSTNPPPHVTPSFAFQTKIRRIRDSGRHDTHIHLFEIFILTNEVWGVKGRLCNSYFMMCSNSPSYVTSGDRQKKTSFIWSLPRLWGKTTRRIWFDLLTHYIGILIKLTL